jgi:hypothetical protein
VSIRPGVARWLVLSLLAGCGSAASGRTVAMDAGVDAPPEAAAPHDAGREAPPPERCCVVPSFASYSPYAGCNLLSLIPDAAVDLIQACWDGDGGAGYGRWQCGGPNGQRTWCASGALNCQVGDVCWVPDEDSDAGGCVGDVQPCADPSR